MNPKYYLAPLIVFFTNVLYAQQEIPVNLTTGTTNVTVPLATITDRGLSLPVSLSYNSKGVKITETESGSDYVGINWSINAGGKISRKVNGLPDDYKSASKKGWLIDNVAQTVSNYTITSDNSQTTCTDEAGDWNKFNSASEFLLVDTEPDEFTLQLPGKSIKFVFDKDKIIRTIPYDDIKIIPYHDGNDSNGQISKFEVTTNDGIKYVFEEHQYTLKGSKYVIDMNGSYDETDYTLNDYSGLFRRDYYFYREIAEWDNFYRSDLPGVHFISSWYLSNIISPQKGKISLTYENVQYEESDTLFSGRHFWEEDGTFNETGIVNPLSWDQSYIATREKTLQKRVKDISAESGDMIYFDFYIDDNDYYNDYSNSFRYLNKVCRNVTYYKGLGLNKRELSRSYSLQYDVVSKSDERRTFLKSIQESTQCNSFPPYKFEYFGLYETYSALPKSTSDKVDYWNYFKDHPFTDSYSKKPPYLIVNGVTLVGPDRSVDPSSVIAGSLAKVVFPAGGSVAFQYEPNTYWDGTASIYGPGIRVKKVVYYDDITNSNNRSIEYNYDTVTGQSSGYLSYPTIFTVKTSGTIYRTANNLGNDEDVNYKSVTVKESGRGKTIYEYLAPPAYPQITYDLDPATSEDDWTATEIKLARNQGYGSCNPRSYYEGYYAYPFAQNPNYDFSSPLLSKKTLYKESGKVESEHFYEYQRLPGTPIKVRGIHADFNFGPDLLLGEYYFLTNTNRVLKSEKIITYDPVELSLSSESKTNYFYESAYHKNLNRKTQENSDGAVIQTKIKYVKDYPITTAGDEATKALQRLQNNFINVPVEITESVIRSGTEKVTKATLSKFKFTGTTLPGLLDEVYELPVVTSFTESSVINSGATQIFSADPNYNLVKKIEVYDEVGNPLTISDGKKFKKSFHWGYDQRLPVAEITNASWDDVVYSGGEETPSSNEFNSSDDIRHLDNGFTGMSGTRVSQDYWLEKTMPRPANKKVRFSCKLLGGQYGSSITLELSGAPGGAYIFEYGDNEGWIRIDTVLDVSEGSGPLFIRIYPGDDVTLDDILICPTDVSIKTYAYNPVLGKTSETDSRENITFYEYDQLGRINFIKDRDKNILKEIEYKNKYDTPLVYTSDFSTQWVSGVTQSYSYYESSIYAENTWLFTPVNLCTPEVTHSWYVNGTLLGTASTLQYQFSSAGTYIIKHKANHPVYGEKITEITRIVKPAIIAPVISTTDPDFVTRCAYEANFNNANRRFTAQILSGTSLGTLDYSWRYIREDTGEMVTLNGWWQKSSSITLNYTFSYKVFCVVSSSTPGSSVASNQLKVNYITTCTP